MPTRALHMRKIRDLIRLKYVARLSHEQIARALAISKVIWPIQPTSWCWKRPKSGQMDGITQLLGRRHELPDSPRCPTSAVHSNCWSSLEVG